MAGRNWTIRDAISHQDWDQALALLVAVYVEEGFSPPDWAKQVLSRAILEPQGDFLVVADTDGKILGAVLLLGEQSELRQIAQAGEAEFRLLGVSRFARGNGIGSALVRECLKRAKGRGARRMLLSTQPSMQSAHRLYEGLGFTRQVERDWQTPSGIPRWVYSAELDSAESIPPKTSNAPTARA